MPGFNPVSVNLHSPGPIGDTTPSTVGATIVTASDHVSTGYVLASIFVKATNFFQLGNGTKLTDSANGALSVLTNEGTPGAISTGALTASGTITPGNRPTLAALPVASTSAGQVSNISNPASGKAPFVICDGTSWLYADDTVARSS